MHAALTSVGTRPEVLGLLLSKFMGARGVGGGGVGGGGGTTVLARRVTRARLTPSARLQSTRMCATM